jgi:4-hydroxybenzoate polyprenyltransferase
MTSFEDISIDRIRDASKDRCIWRVLLDISRLHITMIAALGVLTFGWLFIGTHPWLLAVVCALDWYIVNLNNRLVDMEEDETNQISGTRFIGRNRRKLLVFVFVLLTASLVVFHFLNPAITAMRIACHFLGLCYNWPILPGKRRLKQLYFWKNTASALGFLITVFGYPLATACRHSRPHCFPFGITWETIVFSAVFFFLFEISYEIIYDMRDVKGDARVGIRTYPVVHGMRTAVAITDALIFSSMAVLVAGYILGPVPWRIFIMIGAPFLQFIVYKQALRRGISAADCIRITWMGVGLLVVYNVWVFAGLPGTQIS